jgi:hypothetical protein
VRLRRRESHCTETCPIEVADRIEVAGPIETVGPIEVADRIETVGPIQAVREIQTASPALITSPILLRAADGHRRQQA